jgi:hypothetical protein
MTLLLSELDMQVRGGGGVAERLHASCRHVKQRWREVSADRLLSARTPTSVSS